MQRFVPAMRVVLTVPHAVDGRCAPIHCFDPLAASMAQLLADEFRRRGHTATVILSQQNRLALDDNRIAGKRARTPLWQNLGAVLAAGAVDYLVDVHSYPDGGFGRGSGLPVVLTVLHMPDLMHHAALARAFGPAYAALPASRDNAILRAAYVGGVPANLIEFNEALPAADRAAVAARFVDAVAPTSSV